MVIAATKIHGFDRPESSSIVHTKETTVQFDSIPTYGAILRRSCYPEYSAAEQVYSQLDKGYSRDRSWVLNHCRDSAWFVRHDETGQVRVASNSCRLRWCPVCARAKRTYISHTISEWLDEKDHPKFLTLTLKHTNAPLSHQVDHLYRFFLKLRRRKEIKKAITGGIWFFHIKKSKSDGLWHPHLHCIITGLYIPRRRLSRLWVQVTYTSEVVDIRPVRDFDKAACEAARYAACPGSLAGLSLSDQVELVEAMHGRRICGTWGIARTVSLRPQPTYDQHHWTSVGTWQAVTSDYESNHNAEAILFAWKTDNPLLEGIEYHPEETSKIFDPEWDWPTTPLEACPQNERSPP